MSTLAIILTVAPLAAYAIIVFTSFNKLNFTRLGIEKIFAKFFKYFFKHISSVRMIPR